MRSTEKTLTKMLEIVFIFPVLGLFILPTIPVPTSGLHNLKNKETLVECRYLDDIKFTKACELKSLKVSSASANLSSSNFGNNTALQRLDLSHRKLRRIEPGTFSNMRSLLSLDLSHNRLTHLGHGTFEGPMHLRVLNLHGNSLVRIPEDAISLKNLKFLDLSGNNLTCDCQTLKTRDALILQGVMLSTKAICSYPANLKGAMLTEPDAEVICIFEKQDQDPEMQNDQPDISTEGSGDRAAGNLFNELANENISEQTDYLSHSSSEALPKHSEITSYGVPLTTPFISSEKYDELSSTKQPTISSTSLSTESIISENNSEQSKSLDVLTEGSGPDQEDDGSGLGSTGLLIPPITWDNVTPEIPEDEISDVGETVTPNPTSTSTAPGLLDGFFGWFSWKSSEPTTSMPVTTISSEELTPEDEHFIGLPNFNKSSHKQSSPLDSLKPIEGEKKFNVSINDTVLYNSKLQESPSKPSVIFEETQAAGASATPETKKGMGSYIVLGVLLGVLAALIGVAAYKGNFCRERRKNNCRNGRSDVENGTELKDLRKSLLDGTNLMQSKISSYEGKPEGVPLVTIGEEIGSAKNPTTYVASVTESPSDLKPPRKSFSTTEPQLIETKEKVASTSNHQNDQCIDLNDRIINGNNGTNSLGWIREYPSLETVSKQHRTNLISSSPPAQRVKIIMQDNPASIPKTPLLITRSGDNLITTP
ncbi:uncharacterized protein [Fopius arisanus]|uniref:SLIT2_2 protein n=2 Tax=Fopius arisanus TaxID=64838 RepID=A0A0C9QGV7_9HYME|nr:PREDICTED: uncharacterized protein LOC105266002 [Fopius arisanus]XP_011302172.1 PREDICTED: uncharacterized protein LOC105266002 [Fopius arisanus]XP_011302173.1 PREDICTED: uncharacterized protein LOC105266002 [Fopius arisanus]XP_011302174.1 PREDICTED: uncharacterized protein LOC105266002 [Fopius arisanus]